MRSVERRACLLRTSNHARPDNIIRTAVADYATIQGHLGCCCARAGVAALVISANNDLTAAQVCDVLERTASKDLDLEGGTRPPGPSQAWEMAPIPPFQRGDFDHDGWSPWFGFGRVDAFCAVVAAMNN